MLQCFSIHQINFHIDQLCQLLRCVIKQLLSRSFLELVYFYEFEVFSQHSYTTTAGRTVPAIWTIYLNHPLPYFINHREISIFPTAQIKSSFPLMQTVCYPPMCPFVTHPLTFKCVLSVSMNRQPFTCLNFVIIITITCKVFHIPDTREWDSTAYTGGECKQSDRLPLHWLQNWKSFNL